MKDRCIIIVGFMGCGKTTVASALARLRNCGMLDLDEIISEQEDKTIFEIIKERGESGFRRAETFALSAVLKGKRASIIALGGGAWIIERNRALIAGHGCLTIFLDAPFELCWKRISAEDLVRPLALDQSSAHELYRERRPVYELADLRIPATEEKSADDLASEIVAKMKRLRFVKG